MGEFAQDARRLASQLDSNLALAADPQVTQSQRVALLSATRSGLQLLATLIESQPVSRGASRLKVH